MNMITTPAMAGATVKRADLASALALVTKCVERRNTIPILAHVALVGGDDSLTLTGTNMEVRSSATIPAEGARGVNCTADGAMLSGIVSELPGSEVTLIGGQQLKVRQDRFAASLMTLPIADFPFARTAPWSHLFEIETGTLRCLLGRVRHAISTEETRYYLNGVYLEARDDRLRAVATDGHRLAVVGAALPAGAAGMPAMIVPRYALSSIFELFGADGEVMTVMASTVTESRPMKDNPNNTHTIQRVRFTNDRGTVEAKCIDGTYPDYERVIPKDVAETCRLDRDALLRAIKRVSSVTNEKSRPVKLTIGDGVVRVGMQSGFGDEAADEFSADTSGTVEIGFQARYLRALIDNCAGRLVLHCSNGHGPMIAHDEADASALFVLMPMRL